MVSTENPSLGTAQPKSNIFSTPLKAKLEAGDALRKKNHRNAFILLGVASVALAAYSFLFFYPQIVQYLEFGNRLKAGQEELAQLEANNADLEKKRSLHKAAYDSQFKEQQAIIDMVFPETPDKLGVIRLMENFATNLNASYPPFELNSITFQAEKSKDGVTVLPFTTTVSTSRANFDRFLGLVKLSGSTDPKTSDHIRLMDISNITLQYLGTDETGKDLGVSFNVQMNAYSRVSK
jgi:hypothetical protein